MYLRVLARMRSTVWFASLGLFLVSADRSAVHAVEGASGGRIEQILRTEASGQPVDRRSYLSSVSSERAHWQSGRVNVGGKWIPVEELPTEQLAASLSAYEIEREKAVDKLGDIDAEGHRHLALYCRSNDLPLQEKSHWNAILALQPNDLQSRRQLGFQQIGSEWFLLEEIRHVELLQRQTIDDLQRWMPKVRKLVKQMQSGNSKTALRAIEELNSIQDASAIIALEVASLQADPQIVLPLINAIAKQRASEACLSLVRIAMRHETPDLRRAATQAIRTYPMEFYVPELLTLLKLPVSSQWEARFNPKGQLALSRVMFCETHDEKQLLKLSKVVNLNEMVQQFDLVERRALGIRNWNVQLGTVPSREKVSAPILADDYAITRNQLEDQAGLDIALAEANRATVELNAKVISVLEATTSAKLEPRPETWWKWWEDYNVRYSPSKPLRTYYHHGREAGRVTLGVLNYRIYKPMSCLQKGTEIQTARGPVPVNEIKVGDLVVSQDIESGALSLQPVLETTIRPPVEMYSLYTSSGKIEATGGHYWWASGQGWKRTVDLKPGMLLRNATGTTTVERVEESGRQEPAYNLVVDQHHNYFVGPSLILSHDNLDLVPTMRTLPGYGMLAAD